MIEEAARMQVIVTRRTEMGQAELEEFWDLEDIVYPNGFDGPPELEAVVWADPDWDICVRNESGSLVSHAGVLERDALHDGAPVRIAGLAEMLTHPDHKRRGYGAAAMQAAIALMRDDLRSSFALLVCPESAIPFYVSLGWQRFDGTIRTEVVSGMAAFADSAWLVLPLTAPAPTTGVLDLQGIPW